MAKGEDSIRVFVPPETKDRFKASCFHRGLNMSDVAAELIEEWLEENPPPETPAADQPQSVAELVQQHYFALLKDGKVKQEKLNAIAEGEEPSRNDLYIISSVVKIPQRELVNLYKRTFGKAPLSNGEREIEEKRRKPNGTGASS